MHRQFVLYSVIHIMVFIVRVFLFCFIIIFFFWGGGGGGGGGEHFIWNHIINPLWASDAIWRRQHVVY